MTSAKGNLRWRNRWLKGEFAKYPNEKKDKTLDEFEEIPMKSEINQEELTRESKD